MQTKPFAERIHRIMRRVPRWILTAVCLGVILYLTLVPDPLGDEDLPWFPGADKLVHGIMFFGLTLCMLVDAMRSRGWRRLSLPVISLISIIGMSAGIGIEYLQDAMGLGRGKEFGDMVADAFGAIVAGVLWIFVGESVELTEEEHHQTDLRGSSEIKEK
ncbi:MAG: hypothetical protein K2F87_05500 [Muribaculaceae bacterium]|nr:hypothetical protein [Muribaculaceae bacterium]